MMPFYTNGFSPFGPLYNSSNSRRTQALAIPPLSLISSLNLRQTTFITIRFSLDRVERFSQILIYCLLPRHEDTSSFLCIKSIIYFLRCSFPSQGYILFSFLTSESLRWTRCPISAVGGFWKKKESRFCFPSPFFIIVNFTYSWQNCRVHPVVGEFRPAVVHHAAIVVLLSVRIDLVLRQFDEVVEVYALCKISLIAW